MSGLSVEGHYLRYVRDCAGWGVPTQSFEDFKAYWEMFAKDGELATVPTEVDAPILVQDRQLPAATYQPPVKTSFAGHYQQASGHRI